MKTIFSGGPFPIGGRILEYLIGHLIRIYTKNETNLDAEVWKSGIEYYFRRSLKMRQEEVKELADDEEKVIDGGGLPPFWKPEIVGEQEEGELVGIRTLDLGDVLHLRTDQGMKGIPVSTTLAEINFHPFIGRLLRFRFEGTADTKAGHKAKLFRVTVLKKSESGGVPF